MVYSTTAIVAKVVVDTLDKVASYGVVLAP